MKNEVQILKTVSHPFIATLYHYFLDERNVYLLQEFIPGGQLYRLIGQNARLPNNSARFYAAQLVMAMQYLHGAHGTRAARCLLGWTGCTARCRGRHCASSCCRVCC